MARTGSIISALAGLAALAVGGAALAQPGGIDVVAGTYGQSCGVRYGNVTGDLRHACDGQQSCDYTVDVNRLGDPAPGCRKDYVAEWRCPDGQTHRAGAPAEAGFGSVVRLQCWGPRAPDYDGDHHDDYDHGPDDGGGISVISGTYGRSCGVREGNVTRDLATACNGRGDCQYTVDVNRLGDPAPNCRKDFVATWQCPDGQRHSTGAPPEAGLGSVVRLSCWRR
jgi:hypothetical protein